jgi:molybdopterin-guanine dinucleotide biosynthesis protein A
VGAAVLAGGGSRRFGSDKLIAPVYGVPMLRRAVDASRTVAEVVVVQLPHGATEPPTELGDVVVSRDSMPAEGPLAGLADALDLLGGLGVAVSVVVGGDMPSLVPGVLAALATYAASEGARMVVLAPPDDSPVSPLPCAIASEAFPAVGGLVATGERRLRALLSYLGALEIPAETWVPLDPALGSLRDVDTPAELGKGD